MVVVIANQWLIKLRFACFKFASVWVRQEVAIRFGYRSAHPIPTRLLHFWFMVGNLSNSVLVSPKSEFEFIRWFIRTLKWPGSWFLAELNLIYIRTSIISHLIIQLHVFNFELFNQTLFSFVSQMQRLFLSQFTLPSALTIRISSFTTIHIRISSILRCGDIHIHIEYC